MSVRTKAHVDIMNLWIWFI